MVLVSPVEVCTLCDNKLSIRQDRHVCAVIYDEYQGSMPALFTTHDIAEERVAPYNNTMAITQAVK